MLLPEEVAADKDDACEHGEEGDHEGDDAGEDDRVMELHHGLLGPSSILFIPSHRSLREGDTDDSLFFSSEQLVSTWTGNLSSKL